MLASALETMLLREIGPQLKFPRKKANVVISFLRFAHFFFLPSVARTMPGVIRATPIYREKKEMLSSTRV